MIPDDTLAEWEHLARGFRGTILGNAALEMAKEIRRLQATLKAVCEDAFADECPTNGKCDTYGHAEECGAVSAMAHAKNLTAEIRRLREEMDRWSSINDKFQRERIKWDNQYEALQSALAAHQAVVQAAKEVVNRVTVYNSGSTVIMPQTDAGVTEFWSAIRALVVAARTEK